MRHQFLKRANYAFFRLSTNKITPYTGELDPFALQCTHSLPVFIGRDFFCPDFSFPPYLKQRFRSYVLRWIARTERSRSGGTRRGEMDKPEIKLLQLFKTIKMATSLAENYYLKALEAYPWELSEVMENLTYALSYDEHNSAANCLMGQLQMNQLKNYNDAEWYFERAISSDPNFACAYENLVLLYVHINRLKKAQQILEYMQRMPSVSRSFILSKMALILEKRGEFKLSRHYLKSALAESVCNDERTELELDLDRVKSKIKKGKSSKGAVQSLVDTF